MERRDALRIGEPVVFAPVYHQLRRRPLVDEVGGAEFAVDVLLLPGRAPKLVIELVAGKLLITPHIRAR
jgi:hypothetical protein